jgi:hypothetical protein
VGGAYPSVGFNSLNFYNAWDFEMDLPKIHAELGMAGLAATVWFLMQLGKQSLYCYMMMLLVMAEMLTSHFYDITYFWFVLYITLGCAATQSEYRISGKNREKKRIRFLFTEARKFPVSNAKSMKQRAGDSD